jgi:hypothetical protein
VKYIPKGDLFIENIWRFADVACNRDAPYSRPESRDIADIKGEVSHLLNGITETTSIHNRIRVISVLENVDKK